MSVLACVVWALAGMAGLALVGLAGLALVLLLRCSQLYGWGLVSRAMRDRGKR